MMVDAEYQIVQERTLPVIASEIILIEEQVYRTAMEGAIEIGNRLHEAKEKVPHGEWENWCKENLNYSKRKAENMMQIATEYGGENGLISKTHTCAELSISKALRLLRVPEEERESFVEEHQINDMTVKELEAEIKNLKREKKEHELGYEAEIEKLQGEIESLQETVKNTLTSDVDQEEVEKLKRDIRKKTEEIEKLNTKMKSMKEKAKAETEKAVSQEKEKTDRAIQEASEAAKKKLESEMRQLQEENRKLLEEIELAEKRAEKASDEGLLMFKLKVDELQKTFGECVDVIEQSADSEKLRAALITVVKSLIGE